MKEKLNLPPPIGRYLATVNAGDSEAFPSTFDEDARVQDVSRTIRGLDAIRKWARSDIFAVNARLDVVNVTESDGSTVVTLRIDGTFDRTGLPDPLLMDHSFTIADGKITELRITFAPERSKH